MPEAFIVRPIEGPAELAAFFGLAAPTFMRDVPPAVAAPDWRRFMTGIPASMRRACAALSRERRTSAATS